MAIFLKALLWRASLNGRNWRSLCRTGAFASFIVDDGTEVHVSDSASQHQTKRAPAQAMDISIYSSEPRSSDDRWEPFRPIL